MAAYGHGAEGIVIVPVMTGAFVFAADLVRRMPNRLRVDVATVRSYGSGTVSQGPRIEGVMPSVQGRHVLLVDDILDTGKTLKTVIAKLAQLQPRQIKTCVLLNKPARRVEPVEADYSGFDIPDLFVVGYGLDYAERYRNLPFVGVLKPEMYGK